MVKGNRDIRLVVSDMDGTLLDRDHRLPEGFWELERTLHERGIVFAVASGRQYWNLLDVFEPIADRILILAENGTLVMQGGRQLHLRTLSRPDAHRFVELGRTLPQTHVLLCGKECAYVEGHDDQFLTSVRSFYRKVEIVPDLLAVQDDILKVTYCDFRGAEEHSYPHVCRWSGDFKIAVAGIPWLDITHAQADKGVALANIQERLGVTRAQTMVFGDYLNDLELMAGADWSFAMKNAHPRIVEAARFRTRLDHNEGGVLDTIRQVLFESASSGFAADPG
ncbi:MAG: HAD family hydrolase [Fibrobacteres bacterium]|jgi:Cof subfamily protein (haloacid dehalogenase superfamily)|nr:HAD family hydrolase [Fibrobacterota bacterium]